MKALLRYEISVIWLNLNYKLKIYKLVKISKYTLECIISNYTLKCIFYPNLRCTIFKALRLENASFILDISVI